MHRSVEVSQAEDHIKVDTGELIALDECESVVPADDAKELEKPKADVVKEAKAAAKQALESAAEELKEQTSAQQAWLDELRK
ncbi:unnamed protein product [Prorocentrum cordatum]|uniref:Uncharacterized protein n=1 Tax=Prorocentrum cordatum TaxID=2364126 RepID=A0ABN9SQG2_9DINO|nr:unnamed protein product [Polarella glacialis]